MQWLIANVLSCKEYTVVAQLLALKTHILSPLCYRYLQALDCLSNMMTLLQDLFRERLYNILEATNFGFYFKDRNFILLMDEIHVSSTIACTRGRIFGYSMESNLSLSYSTLLIIVVDIIIQSIMTTNIFTNNKVNNSEFRLFCAINALLTYLRIFSNSTLRLYCLQQIVVN